MRNRSGTAIAIARASGGMSTGVVATKASIIAIPAGTAARGGRRSVSTSAMITAATAQRPSASNRKLRETPRGGGGALSRPASGSTRVASRAGHHAAAMAISVPSRIEQGITAG